MNAELELLDLWKTDCLSKLLGNRNLRARFPILPYPFIPINEPAVDDNRRSNRVWQSRYQALIDWINRFKQAARTHPDSSIFAFLSDIAEVLRLFDLYFGTSWSSFFRKPLSERASVGRVPFLAAHQFVLSPLADPSFATTISKAQKSSSIFFVRAQVLELSQLDIAMASTAAPKESLMSLLRCRPPRLYRVAVAKKLNARRRARVSINLILNYNYIQYIGALFSHYKFQYKVCCFNICFCGPSWSLIRKWFNLFKMFD